MVPIFRIIDIFEISRENQHIKTKRKNCSVLSCRISGESLFLYNGKCERVTKGDVLFIPSGSSYKQKCESERVILFHLDTYSDVGEHILIHKSSDREKVCRLFSEALHIWNKRDTGYDLLATARLYEILALCSFNHNRYLIGTKNISRAAIDYIDANIGNPTLSIESLLSKLNISRTYLNRIFKIEFSTTPVHYINLHRIEKAQMLIKDASLSNSDIAHMCGFTDVKYFYVVFKKLTGITTREYKKNLHKNSEEITEYT